jgi:Fur family transcriptional regulator, iron response regulator
MDVSALLRDHGIQPSSQRVAIGRYVLATDQHPSADEVYERVRRMLPALSRATVYNTLNLFVRKGLLRALAIAEGRTVFDPRLARHHHFVDEETGQVLDVPWEQLEVRRIESLQDLEVHDYQVVIRGRRKKRGALDSTRRKT